MTKNDYLCALMRDVKINPDETRRNTHIYRRQFKINKTMDAVKKQIDGLIKYDCTNFDDLKRNFSRLSYRIYEGLTQVKETHVFSDSEISEINDYAKNY